jgi:hypothetical protein
MNSTHKELNEIFCKDAATSQKIGAKNKRPWVTPKLQKSDYEISTCAGSGAFGDSGTGKRIK